MSVFHQGFKLALLVRLVVGRSPSAAALSA